MNASIKDFITWAREMGAHKVDLETFTRGERPCKISLEFRPTSDAEALDAKLGNVSDEFDQMLGDMPDDQREIVLQRRRDSLFYGSS